MITPFSNGVVGVVLFVLLLIWSLVWKGLALWRAAQRGQKWWFTALLTINTFGILEILFLFVFSRKTKSAGRGAVENAS